MKPKRGELGFLPRREGGGRQRASEETSCVVLTGLKEGVGGWGGGQEKKRL